MPINPTLFPYTLFQKSKTLLWDPQAIDLTQDKLDWARMSEREREIILQLSTMFLGGEESVTHDLAPMLVAVRRGGAHLEDEMFLTAQLFEESKHVEWFDRWFGAVVGAPANLTAMGAAYEQLFMQALPQSLNRLLTDSSDKALTEALVTYHLIIEGVLAETGYHAYVLCFNRNQIMPGTVRGVELVQRDEARHIAYGLHTLSALIHKTPALWDVAQAKLNELLPLVFEIIGETFAPFLAYAEGVPFDLDPSDFVTYASEQFDSRMQVLERTNR
jgi:ribonucleoside-diphosphate reductase beta chain